MPALILLLLPFGLLAHAAPAAPNLVILEGTVLEYSVTSSSALGEGVEQPLHKLVVRVEAVADMEDYPNFLKGKKGRDLTVYLNEKPPPEIVGRRIQATVSYRGDERGGRFWIEHLEVMK